MVLRISNFVLFFVFCSCNVISKPSSVDYGALVQHPIWTHNYGRGSPKSETLLIGKVHNDAITFAVVHPEPACLDRELLASQITQALMTWLEGLEIAAYTYKYTTLTKPITKNIVQIEDQSAADLSVIVYCREGRTMVHTRHNQQVSIYGARHNNDLPGVTSQSLWHNANGVRLYYEYSIMLHELGHAFGLADTYIMDGYPDTDQLNATGPTASRSWGTAGLQPFSVMAMYYGRNDLTVDDIRGLAWLYEYYNKGTNINSPDTCLPGEAKDTVTKGCYIPSVVRSPNVTDKTAQYHLDNCTGDSVFPVQDYFEINDQCNDFTSYNLYPDSNIKTCMYDAATNITYKCVYCQNIGRAWRILSEDELSKLEETCPTGVFK